MPKAAEQRCQMDICPLTCSHCLVVNVAVIANARKKHQLSGVVKNILARLAQTA